MKGRIPPTTAFFRPTNAASQLTPKRYTTSCPKMMHPRVFRKLTDLTFDEKKLITNAAGRNENKNPATGLNIQRGLEVIPERTGKPQVAQVRYKAIELTAREGLKDSPMRNTPRVCRVIGTGNIGTLAIASNESTRLAAKTFVTSMINKRLLM